MDAVAYVAAHAAGIVEGVAPIVVVLDADASAVVGSVAPLVVVHAADACAVADDDGGAPIVVVLAAAADVDDDDGAAALGDFGAADELANVVEERNPASKQTSDLHHGPKRAVERRGEHIVLWTAFSINKFTGAVVPKLQRAAKARSSRKKQHVIEELMETKNFREEEMLHNQKQSNGSCSMVKKISRERFKKRSNEENVGDS